VQLHQLPAEREAEPGALGMSSGRMPMPVSATETQTTSLVTSFRSSPARSAAGASGAWVLSAA
jgi:hypothetical protein